MSKATESNKREEIYEDVITSNLRNKEIQNAVKSALDDKRLDDLGVQITGLSDVIIKGFAEIHTRQDTTNGKVLKSERDIAEIKGKSMYDKMVWAVVTALIGVVVYFL